MTCRNETFRVAGASSVRRRLCRTVHGPVQARQGSRTAYARRYAIWNREIDTMRGLAALNTAASVADAGRAARLLSWNENLLVADDGGHIGWWHPGRLPLRPKRWDERLPLPGTGQAEWRGCLPWRAHPQVVDPPQGYIANWNNMPSAGWTNGDAPAAERNAGALHRGAYLLDVVERAAAAPSYDALKSVERVVGTTAQQRVLLDARLRAADAAATGAAKSVLATIVAWDGNYDRTDQAGTVDPGVAAFEELKQAAERTLGAQRGGLARPARRVAPVRHRRRRGRRAQRRRLRGPRRRRGPRRDGARAALRLARPRRVARAPEDVRRRGAGRRAEAGAEGVRPRDVVAGRRAGAVAADRRPGPAQPDEVDVRT